MIQKISGKHLSIAISIRDNYFTFQANVCVIAAAWLVFSTILLNAQTTWQAESVYAAQAKLGEGAIWDERIQKWYWIDIEEGYLFTFEPDSMAITQKPFHEKIGTVVPTRSGNVVVALK